MCYATFVIRNLLFVSFQIISRIMRCFQFIKLGTASLTNNIHDIVRIISVCGYIFRKLIVHVAKFTYSEDCYSHEAIVSSVDPLRISVFLRAMFVVSNKLFLLSESIP